MSAYQRSAPWLKRPALSLVAAPVARLISLSRKGRRVAYYPREIERFRMDFEMKKANVDLAYRFKIM